ncbi:AAA family ATPase [Candidatus Sulfurimonas baltica]|uniref:DNA repair protein RecN n=1 Tax=Candidatus Sulfurimonas baltica TaxID=2740404 RepID=A0A7S7LXJ3_9BACT|nr:AAA family ATPase [Candidatus Sulfurimonas baltica]QOY53318.1 AAA family ATPase [Candidatus Sulfurimonas baltica]
MIERFFLKDYLSFKEVELELNSGLIVFTGPSGSGKSILMNSILASLGSASCDATLCESSVTWDINGEELGIESDDINVFKHIKKEKSRYFINNQSVSKKAMSSLASGYLRHLSLKDFSDFENDNLLSILDSRIEHKEHKIFALKDEYKVTYLEHKMVKKELLTIEDEQRKIVELKEFAAFEIKKIEDINPTPSEDSELLEIKKGLSKKEKVLKNISLANSIFDYEHNVFLALDSLDIDSSFFGDSMNELRAIMESAEDKFSALDEVDVEDVLNRIEALSELKRRYGSIEDALKYKEQKILELKKYENIEMTKGDLEQREAALGKKVRELAQRLNELRHVEIKLFTDDLNRYLKELYLREAQVDIKEVDYELSGKDEIVIKLNSTELQKVSTGEFNRLRLAILALKSEFMGKNGGILMLDEIDANLSGEESMSVAKVLKQLSKHFQIFVISHQPQLTSMGDQHFLIHKNGDESLVKKLEHQERVDEIARIISGDRVTDEAKRFAKELLHVQK